MRETVKEISSEDLEKVEDIIEKVAEEKQISLEEEELHALKEDVQEYKEVRGHMMMRRNIEWSGVMFWNIRIKKPEVI